MGLAQELLDKQSQLEAARATYDSHCSEIAKLVLPRQDSFFNETITEGDRKSQHIYDSTAVLAHDKAVKIVDNIITPEGSYWNRLTVPEENLKNNQEVNEFLDNTNDFLYRQRYRPKANFANQNREKLASLLAFGNGVLLVEDLVGRGIRYRTSHISEHYFMENQYGIIDIDYRKYKLTARQAVERFGDKTPEKVMRCYEKTPNEKIDFLHVVMPDESGESGFAYISYNIYCDGQELISTGGYRTFPYIISRGATSPNEVYGRSPAMLCLPEIKMLNAMRKTDIKSRHQAVDPAFLAADASTLGRFLNVPNAINYGTLDINGNQLIKPFVTGARIDLSNDGIAQSREFINDTFFITLFQILVQTPQMTATEVLERAKEKNALLGSEVGREQQALAQMIEREISIYEGYGIFEDGSLLPMPKALKDAGGIFEIEFTAPANQMMKSEEALSVERTIQSLLPLAQIDPSVIKRIDFKEYADIIREANGAPAKLFKSDEEMAALAQAEAQQMQLQQMLAAAPQVASTVKDFAQAEAMR